MVDLRRFELESNAFKLKNPPQLRQHKCSLHGPSMKMRGKKCNVKYGL